MNAGKFLISVGLTLISCAGACARPNFDYNKTELTPELDQSIRLKGLLLGTQKAIGDAQHAECIVSFWYASDGIIQIAQLVKISGFPKVDQACLQVFIGQRIKQTVASAYGGWSHLGIRWVFKPQAEQSKPMEMDPSIPVFGSKTPPLPDYPQSALEQHAHGICKMHVTVLARGQIDTLFITQSTGSEDLDRECLLVVMNLPVEPAKNEGEPIRGTTDIAIDWRLPRSASPSQRDNSPRTH